MAEKIACGNSHTLILTANGSVYGFGSNELGQLGLGHKKPKLSPSFIQNSNRLKIIDIQAGYHSAAITFQGEVYIWGTCDLGQFLVPTRIAGELEEIIVDLKMGNGYTILLDVRGKLWAFGNNEQGCLGLGDRSIHRGLIEVKGLKSSKIKKICCGNGYVIAAGGKFSENNLTPRADQQEKSFLAVTKVPIDEFQPDRVTKGDRSYYEGSDSSSPPRSRANLLSDFGIRNSPPTAEKQPLKIPNSITSKRGNAVSEIPPNYTATTERSAKPGAVNLSNYTKSKPGKLTARDQRQPSDGNITTISTARLLTNYSPRDYTPVKDDAFRKFYSPSAKSQLSASRIENVAITDVSMTSNQNYLQLLSPSNSNPRTDSVKRSSGLLYSKRATTSKNNSIIEPISLVDPYSDLPIVALQPNIHAQYQDLQTTEIFSPSKSFARNPTFGKPDGKDTPLFPRSGGNSQLPSPRKLSEVPLIFLNPNNHGIEDPFSTSHSRIEPLYSRNPSYISKSNSMSLFLSPNRSYLSHGGNHKRTSSEAKGDIYSNSPRGSAKARKLLEAERYIMEITEPDESNIRLGNSIKSRNNSGGHPRDHSSSPPGRSLGSLKYPSLTDKNGSLNLDEMQGSGEKLKSNGHKGSPGQFDSRKYPNGFNSEGGDGLHQWEVSSIVRDSVMSNSPTYSSKQMSNSKPKQGQQGVFDGIAEDLPRNSPSIKPHGGFSPSLELSGIHRDDARFNTSPQEKGFPEQFTHRLSGRKGSSPNANDDRRTAAFNSPGVGTAINSPRENYLSNLANTKTLSQNVEILAGFTEKAPSQKYFTKSPRTSCSPQRDSRGRPNEEIEAVVEETPEANKKKGHFFGGLTKVEDNQAEEEGPYSSPYFPKRQLSNMVQPITIDKKHSRSPSNDFSFESSPLQKGTSKNSPVDTRKATRAALRGIKEVPDLSAISNQIKELKAENEKLRKKLNLRMSKYSELEERLKALSMAKPKVPINPNDTPEVIGAKTSLEEKSKKQRLLNKKLANEKEKLDLLETDNKKLKDLGCEGVDADKLIRENGALSELVKYVYELRALDMEKNVHKDTKAMVETRVNNLMRRLRIDNIGQIQKEVTPRGGNTPTADVGLDDPFKIAPLQGVPIVETMGDNNSKLRLTFIKTLPNAKDPDSSNTKRTEKDQDGTSSKSRDRSFQLNKSNSRIYPNSANRDLSDLQDSYEGPDTKTSNSPFESRQATPKRETEKRVTVVSPTDTRKDEMLKSANPKASVSSAETKSFTNEIKKKLNDKSLDDIKPVKSASNKEDVSKIVSPEKASKSVVGDKAKEVSKSKSAITVNNPKSTIKAENSPAPDSLKSPQSKNIKLPSSSSDKKK